MSRINVSKRMILGVTAGLGTVLVLSGCAQLSPLPDEERYQYINQVKNGLSYAAAGEIISERNDHGDGVFSPSFFYAEIEGEASFDTLTTKSKEITTRPCTLLSTNQTKCKVQQVDILISRDSLEDDVTRLQIIDRYNGRDPE